MFFSPVSPGSARSSWLAWFISTAAAAGAFDAISRDRRVQPVDARAPRRRVDVRILWSTRVPLVDALEARTFREDLYYRLNLMYLEIPPLRERRSDVDPLLEHFTSHHAERRGVERPPLTGGWRTSFDTYEWPGNVRELEAAAHRLVADRQQ
jgi:sigma-54-specific transcriptional regulator